MDNVLSYLQKHHKTLQTFHSVLQDEKQCLENNQMDAFEQLIKRKNTLIEEMQSELNALQSNDSNQNMEALLTNLRQQTNDHHLQKLLDAIRDLSLACDHQNQVNGMLIIAHQNLNERMLDLLTGRQENRTYSKKAKAYAQINSVKSQRV